ncbi:MAG: mechanosensitive ion channel [Thermoanaerobaculia bacterium]|nr:MAG: mechanosensitive ion channel [Thermoanaerobaculia bacterium]
MPTPWLRPLLAALAVALALEVVYFLVRGRFPRPFERLRLQVEILALTVVAFLTTGRGEALLPFGLDEPLLKASAFVAVVLGFGLAYLALDRVGLARRLDARGRPAVPRLVRDLLAWLVVVAAVVLAGAWFYGLDLKSIALPSAVLSAVLGFALQDVLKNVFAGLALQTEQPFDLGDWLVVDGEPRRVIEMSWRSTHLRNNLGVDFREPNANLVAASITNLGGGERAVGFAVHVGVAYGAPPRLVKDALESAAASAPGVAAEPPPQALLHRFADSAVEYELRYWSREVHAAARLRDAVQSRVWYRLHRDGWTIPFPIRTVQLETASRIAADKLSWRARRAESLLARTDLFSGLDPEVRRRLAEAAGLAYFDAGERLVEEGEAGDSLMLVSRGSVVVTKSGLELGTDRVTLAMLKEGSYFGEMSLLTGAPRSATVTAEGAVEAFVLDRAALAPILEADPAIAETL